MTIPSTLLAGTTHLVPFAKELDENKVTPGALGFVVFALLGGAAWMLMKNMNKQFSKINFDEGRDDDDRPAASGTAGTAAPATDGAAASAPADPGTGPQQK